MPAAQEPEQDPFARFELSRRTVGEVSLRFRVGGSGPPLLLLHGYPQTHAMWDPVAAGLAADFTVVAPTCAATAGARHHRPCPGTRRTASAPWLPTFVALLRFHGG